MAVIKLIDTCTIINVVDQMGYNLEILSNRYDILTSDLVIEEYSRKFNQPTPPGINVIKLSDEYRKLVDELEFMFPSLGMGERSLIALANQYSLSDNTVIIITDDKKAVKKINNAPILFEIFKGLKNVIWGDKYSLIKRICG